MKKTIGLSVFVGTQVLVVSAVVVVWIVSAPETKKRIHASLISSSIPEQLDITVTTPERVEPLYDDSEVVSDAELAMVLSKIQPVFERSESKPNFVEHALRTWGVDAEFQNPSAMSGIEMTEFLTDHGKYLASWGDTIAPLLEAETAGVKVRWGSSKCASFHHDHLLACLTEAGITRDHPVFTPTRNDQTINDVLQQALFDFRVDERETEWSVMAFGLWLAPSGIREWRIRDGRQVTFDMLAARLIRGQRQLGVCCGTHRVYSLTVLLRLDDNYRLLSSDCRHRVYSYLETVRDSLLVSQFDDGHWPPNWPEGEKAVEIPSDEPLYRSVIATGHHLEWLSIAPKELHPPRERIARAADWIIAQMQNRTNEQIMEHFTFYSHVGAALASWRDTRPADFWKQWEQQHPWRAGLDQVHSGHAGSVDERVTGPDAK